MNVITLPAGELCTVAVDLPGEDGSVAVCLARGHQLIFRSTKDLRRVARQLAEQVAEVAA